MPSSHYTSTSRPLAPDLPHLVLEELLGKQPYRDMWGQFVQRRRSTGINIRAVAAFMAYELSDAAGHEISLTKFKDSIRRALKGDALTDRMVMRLISAFGFTEEESDQLWSSVIRYRSTEKSAGAPTTTTKNRGVPEREYEVLSEVLTLEIDKDGLIRQLEVTETLISQQDGLQYLMPFFEGTNLDIEILDGGELVPLLDPSHGIPENDLNDIYNIKVKTPYPLYKGEIHMYRLRARVNETAEDNHDYTNHIGIGASDIPKLNITIILNFEEAPTDIRHYFWDNNAYENPVVEEILNPGRLHYSRHYPIVHKAYCGFMWPIRRPDGSMGKVVPRTEISLLEQENDE